MERTLSALQINFYFISSVCLQYVKTMPSVANISSTAIEQFQRKQTTLLAYCMIESIG